MSLMEPEPSLQKIPSTDSISSMSPEAIVISPENTYFAQTALYGHLYGMTEHTTYNQTAGNSKVSLLLALLSIAFMSPR